MTMIRLATIAPLLACRLAWQAHGFAPVQLSKSDTHFSPTSRRSYPTPTYLLAIEPTKSTDPFTKDDKQAIVSLVAATPIVVGLFTSLPAEAAEGDSFFLVASALIAYMHYAGMFAAVACLVSERMIIARKGFGEEDEDLLSKVDIAYGLVGVPIFVSGYLRVTQYGKASP